MFHHMPKSGGTSFAGFLEAVLNLRKDYIGGGGKKKNPERYARYVLTAVDLSKLQATDCLAGHYNLDGSFLWQRYPNLEDFEHKKFTILREPLDAAISGVRFGVERGKLPAVTDDADQERLILARSNFVARILGITKRSEIKSALDRYWFMAPLPQIDLAAKIIENEVGRKGPAVERLKVTTTAPATPLSTKFISEFHKASALDYEIWEIAQERFAEIITRT